MAKNVLTWMSGAPAVLGGDPAFPEGLPLLRSTVPSADRVADEVRRLLSEGAPLTNGLKVKELELRCAEYLQVQNCVAVSSCTAGLMLVLRAANLSGDVVLPSFTFAATAHAVAWNSLRPVFADIDPYTLTLSPQSVMRTAGVRTSAILATHTFGTPCDVEGLSETANRDGIKLYFDAAHAFGSRYRGRPIGSFGDAEIFSLSPTKVVVAGEGGIIATNDQALAERCRIGRDYANPGDYNCRFVGLNARMSELHAIVALASLEGLDERIEQRNRLVGLYRESLAEIPGVSFPSVRAEDRSTYKDFTVLVDAEEFGLDAGRLAKALRAEGIDTRRYYYPPVHAMQAYRSLAEANGRLSATDRIAANVLTLPFWGEMTEGQLAGVAGSIDRIRRFMGRADLNGDGSRGEYLA